MDKSALVRKKEAASKERKEHWRLKKSAVVVWIHSCDHFNGVVEVGGICPCCQKRENGEIAGHCGGDVQL